VFIELTSTHQSRLPLQGLAGAEVHACYSTSSRLAPHGLICVDDVRTRQVIVPIGDGLTLIRRA